MSRNHAAWPAANIPTLLITLFRHWTQQWIIFEGVCQGTYGWLAMGCNEVALKRCKIEQLD
jgi:hypothetical protein